MAYLRTYPIRTDLRLTVMRGMGTIDGGISSSLNISNTFAVAEAAGFPPRSNHTARAMTQKSKSSKVTGVDKSISKKANKRRLVLKRDQTVMNLHLTLLILFKSNTVG